MTKKTPETTLSAPKAAPITRRKASPRAPITAGSTARVRRSSPSPKAPAPAPLDAPETGTPQDHTDVTPVRTRAKRPAAAPQRRVEPAAPAVSHVILPAPAVEAPALPTVAMAGAPSRATVAAVQPHTTPEPTHDEVSTRAYYIYLARVGTCGDPEQDWAAALSELRKERRLSTQEPQD
jgi:hypothetical protein